MEELDKKLPVGPVEILETSASMKTEAYKLGRRFKDQVAVHKPWKFVSKRKLIDNSVKRETELLAQLNSKRQQLKKFRRQLSVASTRLHIKSFRPGISSRPFGTPIPAPSSEVQAWQNVVLNLQSGQEIFWVQEVLDDINRHLEFGGQSSRAAVNEELAVWIQKSDALSRHIPEARLTIANSFLNLAWMTRHSGSYCASGMRFIKAARTNIKEYLNEVSPAPVYIDK